MKACFSNHLVGQQCAMSDSDLMKSGGPASRAPECCSPPTPRMELLSPSKVKDCSQNVTEKVTQVREAENLTWAQSPLRALNELTWPFTTKFQVKVHDCNAA